MAGYDVSYSDESEDSGHLNPVMIDKGKASFLFKTVYECSVRLLNDYSILLLW